MTSKEAGVSYALKLLGLREYSAAEIVTRLLHKGLDETTAHAILTDLQQRAWQSDERFAEIYIRSRLAQGFGPIKIAYELQQKGVERSLIHTLLQQSWDWQQAFEIAARKNRTQNPQFFFRRGFDGVQVRTFFKEKSEGLIE